MSAENPVSPKVTVGGGVGIGGTLVTALLTSIDGAVSDWAGEWTPVIYMGVVVLLSIGMAYAKHDPARAVEYVYDYLSGQEQPEDQAPAMVTVSSPFEPMEGDETDYEPVPVEEVEDSEQTPDTVSTSEETADTEEH